VLAACGGSSKSDPGPDPSTQAPVDAGHPDPITTADGGADPDATPVVPPSSEYPAKHHPLPQLTNLGGTVIANLELVTVTFAGNKNRDDLRAFDDMIIASDWWDAVSRGFGINKGKGAGYAELEDTISNTTLDDNDIGPLLQKQLDAKKLPAPNANTLYAIYLPASTTITLTSDGEAAQSCRTFLGYHSSANVKLEDGKTLRVAYAIMPDCGQFGSVYETASHEFIEAATDPHPIADDAMATYYLVENDAWLNYFGQGAGEVADLCAGRGAVSVGGYDVSRSWVNAAAKESKAPCQPSDPGKLYFGAAVETETATVQDPDGTSRESDGFITLKRGEKKEIEVVVFSEAKLPKDVGLAVGRLGNSTDPAKLSAIATGVTASLSKTTGHNGDKVTLTLAADANAQAGERLFVVRAILEQDDYNSWPVILRVQ
jgi:hypothetical protein